MKLVMLRPYLSIHFATQNTRGERRVDTKLSERKFSFMNGCSIFFRPSRVIATQLYREVRAAHFGGILLLSIATSLFSGCGRHETTGGGVGAAAGAIIGASLTDKRNQATGAVLGGIIGNMIGGSAGRVADQEEAQERRHEERVQRNRELELLAREAEARRGRTGLDRWCLSCHRQNNIEGAKRCPSCGDTLVREKYCNGCLTTFAATSVYRYCPYCYDRQRLICR